MNKRGLVMRSRRGPLVAWTLIGSVVAAGCGAGPGTATSDPASNQKVSRALSSTPPATFAEGLKDLLEISDTVGKAFSGPVAIFEAYDILQKLLGEGFEAEVEQDLAALRVQIQDVAAKIAEGQQVVSAQVAADDIAAAQAAAESARRFVEETGGAVFDPNTNPAAALADRDSRTAVVAFEDDAWYSKVSAAQGAPREFEWRLGLPHLISAIGYRLEVIAAMHPDFVTSGAYAAELMEVYDAIGLRLAQADTALIWCTTQPVVIRPGNDLNLPIRNCWNLQTGDMLPVGTIANPIPDAIVHAQLLDLMGFNAIRAFRDRLYALANNLPANLTFCSNEWETCSASGLQTTRFGVDGGYYYRTTNGPFSCTNDIFGDPAPGAAKSCEVGDVISYLCSDENSNCYFDGVKYVTYGGGGGSTAKLALSGIECSNGVFGDPSSGEFKSCTYRDPVWTPCATEGGTCTLSGTNFVRFGYGDKYRYWQQTGSFPCNNSGGDPAVGFTKVCEVASVQ